MLGRHQLRIKAMQTLYAHYVSGSPLSIVEKNMFNSMEKIYDLYIYQLNLLLALREMAKDKISIGLRKIFPTEQEKKPNRRWIENILLEQLNENIQRRDYTEKNMQLSWMDQDSLFLDRLFKQLENSVAYKAYMSDNAFDYQSNKLGLITIFKELIDSDDLIQFIEDKDLLWVEDYAIANTMVIATLDRMRDYTKPQFRLLSVFKDEDDKNYFHELLQKTIIYEKELIDMIAEKSSRWDLSRIALVDRVIMQLALCEFLYFNTIPTKVTLNEYVEISKSYASLKSGSFINGILDRCLKNLENEGRIRKEGRGLL